MKGLFHLIACLLLIIMSISCSKENIEKDEEEISNNSLREHSDFNSKIVSEVGNVFIEKDLISNNPLQLVSKTEFQLNEIYHYAQLDANRAIMKNQILLVKDQSGDSFVSEINGEKSSLRFYSIDKNSRSEIALEVDVIDKLQLEISLVDVDWNSGKTETLASAYILNGKTTSRYNKMSTAKLSSNGKSVSTCISPISSGVLINDISSFLSYLKCMLDVAQMNEELEKFANEITISRGLINKYQSFTPFLLDAFSKMTGKFHQFKTDPLPQNDKGKSFTKLLIARDTIDYSAYRLVLVDKSSNTTWDNAVDTSRVHLALQLIREKDKKPFLLKPVFVDLKIVRIENAKEIVLYDETTPTDPQTGIVKFSFNPFLAVPILQSTDKIKFYYKVSSSELDHAEGIVNVVDNIPENITVLSGDKQTVRWKTKLKEPFKIIVKNKAGKPLQGIKINWEIEGGGSIAPIQSITDVNGIAETYFTAGERKDDVGKVIAKTTVGDGRIISQKQPFVYSIQKPKYTLLVLKYKNKTYNYENQHTLDGNKEIAERWNEGDDITVYNRMSIPMWIEKDGVIQRDKTGRPYEFALSGYNIGNQWSTDAYPFQKNDIIKKNAAIHITDYDDGALDSIVVDLTISNKLYRKFVGSQIEFVETKDFAGEIYTFQFGKDHVVTNGKINTYDNGKSFPIEIVPSEAYVPIYACDDKGSYYLKKTIGIIGTGRPSVYAYMGGFLLYEDDSISLLNSGTGYRPCDFLMYWNHLRYLPGK